MLVSGRTKIRELSRLNAMLLLDALCRKPNPSLALLSYFAVFDSMLIFFACVDQILFLGDANCVPTLSVIHPPALLSSIILSARYCRQQASHGMIYLGHDVFSSTASLIPGIT